MLKVLEQEGLKATITEYKTTSMYVMLSIAITTLFRGLSNRENIQVVAFTAPNRQMGQLLPPSLPVSCLPPSSSTVHAFKSVASVSESRITSSKLSSHGPHKGPSFFSVVYYEEWRLIDVVVIQQTARKSTGGSSSSPLMGSCS